MTCYRFKKMHRYVLNPILAVVTLSVPAMAQDCPPHLRARLDRANAIVYPTGFTSGMATLPEVIDPADPNVVEIKSDTSRITADPAYKDFVERYKTNPLNVAPAASAAATLHNVGVQHAHASSQAELACRQIGLINKRLLEIRDEREQWVKQYIRDEWIDFSSNALQLSGTIISYFTGAGQAVQYSRAALKVSKLKNAAAANNAIYEVAKGTIDPKMRRLLELQEHWRKFPAAFNPSLAGHLDELAKVMQQLTAHGAGDAKALLGLISQAEQVAQRLGIGLSINVGANIARGVAGAVAAPCQTDAGCDTLTTVILGGNVWEQFNGYKDPFDEMINILFTQKKKFLQKFQTSIAQAESFKRSVEATATELVKLSNTPPPPGIGYGGFSVSYEEG